MAIKPTVTPRNDRNKTPAVECEAGEFAHVFIKSGEDNQVAIGNDLLEGQSCDLEQRAAVLEAETHRPKGEIMFSVSEACAMLKNRRAGV